jgi:hypothetical protein
MCRQHAGCLRQSACKRLKQPRGNHATGEAAVKKLEQAIYTITEPLGEKLTCSQDREDILGQIGEHHAFCSIRAVY